MKIIEGVVNSYKNMKEYATVIPFIASVVHEEVIEPLYETWSERKLYRKDPLYLWNQITSTNSNNNTTSL